MSNDQVTQRRRGRPKAAAGVPLDTILTVALEQFATLGYEGVSMRTMTRVLGVSHNLLCQRFGTKDDLWRAAVEHGFGDLANEMQSAFDPTVGEPLEQLRLVVRRCLVHSASRPELLGLLNNEGCQDTERLRHIYETYIEPSQVQVVRLLDHLTEEGAIRPISHRSFFFLLVQGGAAPFALSPLARLLDPAPADTPAAIEEQADLVATVLVEGLRLPSR
ncbi:TetR/AcrR family transcriptional regulator [Streptomyces sp. NPDC004539]|uniref:TetR/AcrR family transcriptional regulator n=1 Tax=Streptomyces sp. NPDC004539 TaxID=3154280 RepID=UPI0033A04486